MTKKLVVAALALLSLAGCVVVPLGWGHHHGGGDRGRHYDHRNGHHEGYRR